MGGNIQRKGDHRHHDRRNPGAGKNAVIQKEQQHQHGRAAKHRNIERSNPAGHRVLAGAEQADQRPDHRSNQQRQCGDLDRDPQSPQDGLPGSALYQNFIQFIAKVQSLHFPLDLIAFSRYQWIMIRSCTIF